MCLSVCAQAKYNLVFFVFSALLLPGPLSAVRTVVSAALRNLPSVGQVYVPPLGLTELLGN